MIRAAHPRDAEPIAAIWNTIIRDTTVTFTTVEKTRRTVEALIAAQPVWVAEAAGGVAGFALYAPFRAGPGYAQTLEHSIHLAPDARGQGIGRTLMTTLEAHAKAAGHRSLIAGIGGENTNAIAFHEALGFARVGHIPDAGWKFDRWHDLVLMQKFL